MAQTHKIMTRFVRGDVLQLGDLRDGEVFSRVPDFLRFEFLRPLLPSLIDSALLRQASRERRITKTRGAYFMATVKDLAARWAAAPSALPS